MPAFSEFQGDFKLFSYSILLDEQNRNVPIARLWNQRPVVFVFLRHFGCISCRAYSQTVWANRDHFEQKQVNIVFVGNGRPEQISEFRAENNLIDATVLTDPSMKVHRSAGLLSGLSYLFNPSSMKNVRELKQKGFKNDSPLKTPLKQHLQMGGILVVQPSGKVTYQYIEEALGDHANPAEI